jgi:hypothetical protein
MLYVTPVQQNDARLTTASVLELGLPASVNGMPRATLASGQTRHAFCLNTSAADWRAIRKGPARTGPFIPALIPAHDWAEAICRILFGVRNARTRGSNNGP